MPNSFLKIAAACGVVALALSAFAGQEKGNKSAEVDSTRKACGSSHPDKNAAEMGCRPNQVKMPLAMSDGVVEEVDKENRSITLRHGPIKSATIEMGPMTMPFPVRDASLLAKVKVGDKVRFTAEFIDNEATITSLVVRK